MAIQTAQEQLLWTQRIRKEEGVNAKVNPEGFSVQAAIRSADVPKRFKPGHVDPTKVELDESFDPRSKLGRELTAKLAEAKAPARNRYMFPETCTQDHGWYQKDPAVGPELSGKATLAGALPRAGIGWMLPEAEKEAARGNRDKRSHRTHSSKSGARGNSGRRPESTRQADSHGGCSSGAVVYLPGSSTKAMITGHPSLPGGSILTIAGRTASAPSLERGSWASGRVPVYEDPMPSKSLEDAMNRSRVFMNRNPRNHWYRPLGNSDVSQFVDAYTKCWGVELYGKSSK